MLKKLVAIAVALLLGATAIPSYAESSRIRVSNPPSEFIIGDPDNPNPELNLSVIVTGPQRSNITVEFIDYVYDEKGQKEKLPGNSTSYSLAKIFNVKPFDNSYIPSKSGKEFIVTLIPKAKKINQIYYGGIKVTMEPVSVNPGKSTGAALPSGSIVSQVNVTPFGFKGDLENGKIQAAQINGVSFIPVNRTTLIDYMLPDLPGLVNSSPIEARVRFENKGTMPVFVTTSWKFTVGGKVVASKSTNKTLAVAGQEISSSVLSQAQVSGSQDMLNVLPGFGLVDIETTVQSELGGTKFEPQVNKSTVLIMQWKEPFFFTLVGAALIWFLLRKRPAPSSSAQPDISAPTTNKPAKNRKEPSLLWLAIIALRKWLTKKLKKQRS